MMFNIDRMDSVNKYIFKIRDLPPFFLAMVLDGPMKGEVIFKSSNIPDAIINLTTASTWGRNNIVEPSKPDKLVGDYEARVLNITEVVQMKNNDDLPRQVDKTYNKEDGEKE